MSFMSVDMNKIYLRIYCELILEVHECVYIIYNLFILYINLWIIVIHIFLFLMYTVCVIPRTEQ